MNESPVKAHPV